MNNYSSGAISQSYWQIESGTVQVVEAGIIAESSLAIYVNCQDVATLMCSPIDQEALALGFLYNEELIYSLSDVGLLKTNNLRSTIDVFLKQAEFSPPRRVTLTSGCGGGITLQQLTVLRPALATDFVTIPDVIFEQMRGLKSESHLYNQVRGVHTSILTDGKTILASAEDVGRHNTIDKIAGKSLLLGLNMQDCILLTSGRISSEMLNKARRMGIPVVASRTSPTSMAAQMAHAWNICIAGYVRQGQMRVYTHPWRMGLTDRNMVLTHPSAQ